MRNVATLTILAALAAGCGEAPPPEAASQPLAAQEADLELPAQPAPGVKSQPDSQVDMASDGFDPLLARNVDVMDPDRKEYIEHLRPASLSDEWVFLACRQLRAAKQQGRHEDFERGLAALNEKLKAADSPNLIEDVGDETVTIVDVETGKKQAVPVPHTPRGGAWGPRENPNRPRGYMPPYERPGK